MLHVQDIFIELYLLKKNYLIIIIIINIEYIFISLHENKGKKTWTFCYLWVIML